MHKSGLICGVDEAGRGPLAGPVYAAAVILDPKRRIEGLADSKQLTAKRRQQLAEEIKVSSLDWFVAWASVEEIDTLNILRAALLAMQRAVRGLRYPPAKALIDGNVSPSLDCHAETIVGGDVIEPAISAASILAKVERDAEMQRLHGLFPVYGLDRHKGYPTQQHLSALAQYGVCEIHRRSFAPVRKIIHAMNLNEANPISR
jgi:ribonuclease HII